MKIKTLVVDDEPLARERLRDLLREESDIELAGECANGREAVAVIQKEEPDLVFLDVQMPELDGFGVLGEIDGPKLPFVIFVTAFDRFALKAFEVHAVDYLLKPFDRERFQAALQRVRAQIQQRQTGDLHKRLSSLLEDLGGAKVEKGETRGSDRIAIKIGGKVRLFRLEQIDWIEAADNYVNLRIGHESLLHRETMSAMESRLPPEQFARISRSTIVNLERIRELQPLFHGDYVVILNDGTKLNLSRGYREKLSHLLG